MWPVRALMCFHNWTLHRYKSVGSSTMWEVKPGASVTEELQRQQPLLWPGRERRPDSSGWPARINRLIPKYPCPSLPLWMGAAQHCKYRQLCWCLEADKKATRKALSFLPRGTAGSSRVTLIYGVEQIFLLALVIPLVKRELPNGGLSAGRKVYDFDILIFCIFLLLLLRLKSWWISWGNLL